MKIPCGFRRYITDTNAEIPTHLEKAGVYVVKFNEIRGFLGGDLNKLLIDQGKVFGATVKVLVEMPEGCIISDPVKQLGGRCSECYEIVCKNCYAISPESGHGVCLRCAHEWNGFLMTKKDKEALVEAQYLRLLPGLQRKFVQDKIRVWEDNGFRKLPNR